MTTQLSVHRSFFPVLLSGHIALRHPQSNENGRYERGEALTENKALSAYFQGRTVRRAVPGAAPAKRRSWRRAPGPEPPARWACSPPRAGSGTRKPAARDAPTAAGHRPGQPLPARSRRPVTAARSPGATAPRCAPPQDSGFGVRGSGFGNSRRGDRLGSPDVFSRTPSLASRLQDSGFGVRDSGIPDVGTGQVRPMLFHEPRVPNPESRLWRSAPKATAAGPRLPPRPNGDRRRPSR